LKEINHLFLRICSKFDGAPAPRLPAGQT
jgi:hypothetical protein